MHLRRALLLFAVVLGLAALAASISNVPRERSGGRSAQPPAVSTPGGPAAGTLDRPPGQGTVTFTAGRRAVSRSVRAGVSVQVVVKVPHPGQVEIQGLGLTAPAEPLTPATFSVLVDTPGRFPVVFQSATTEQRLRAGVLAVKR